MNINKNNYEHFLMDYLDGKLTANEVSEVLLFLEQHPDIKAEFEGLAEVSISVLPVSKPSFTHLKKPSFKEVKEQYEPLLIANLEGDIDEKDIETLNRGKQLYPELLKEEQLFTQTKCSPDDTVTYPFKQSLKKGGLWITHRNTIIRAAAVLVMSVSIGWYFLGEQPLPKQSAVVTKDIRQTPQITQNKVASRVKQANNSRSVRHQSETQNETKEPARIERYTVAFTTIQESNHTPVIVSEPSKMPVELDRQSFAWLSIPQPQQPVPVEPSFPDLKLLAANELAKGTKQLEDKASTALTTFNKMAGVNMEKDEVTGKVKKFEIAVLGFEWSQSK